MMSEYMYCSSPLHSKTPGKQNQSWVMQKLKSCVVGKPEKHSEYILFEFQKKSQQKTINDKILSLNNKVLEIDYLFVSDQKAVHGHMHTKIIMTV